MKTKIRTKILIPCGTPRHVWMCLCLSLSLSYAHPTICRPRQRPSQRCRGARRCFPPSATRSDRQQTSSSHTRAQPRLPMAEPSATRRDTSDPDGAQEWQEISSFYGLSSAASGEMFVRIPPRDASGDGRRKTGEKAGQTSWACVERWARPAQRASTRAETRRDAHKFLALLEPICEQELHRAYLWTGGLRYVSVRAKARCTEPRARTFSSEPPRRVVLPRSDADLLHLRSPPCVLKTQQAHAGPRNGYSKAGNYSKTCS